MGTRLWWLGLIIVGSILLLFNFGLWAPYRAWVEYGLAAILAVAGLVQFAIYQRTPAFWWRLIPAWTLFALAVTIFINRYIDSQRPILAAALLLGLTLAFWHVYLLERTLNWWAMVLGGFLLVVGVISGVSSQSEGGVTLATLLPAGLGLVFFVLYLLSDQARFWWALIPGGALLLVALLSLSADAQSGNPWLNAWPLLLILAGALVAWQDLRRRKGASSPATAAKLVVQHARPIKPPTTRSGVLGEYAQPAPGATIDVLSDEEQ